MREYFRWATALDLGARADPLAVGSWISRREQVWEGILDSEDERLSPLPLAEGLDAYDEIRVNQLIERDRLVYGAGIGRFGVPIFFLAKLETRFERNGVDVVVADGELARGYVATPAVSRGSRIVVRLDALRRWLWTRAETALAREPSDAFRLSLAAYAGAGPMDAAIDRMARGEIETLTLHEIGELRVGAIVGPDWERMIAQLGDRRSEIVVRAVRDLLADSMVTLPALLERRAEASLSFWFSNFDGMRRELAPQLQDAWADRSASGRGDRLSTAIANSRARWSTVVVDLLAAWRSHGAGAVVRLARTLHPI
jgi:hypothetical protein